MKINDRIVGTAGQADVAKTQETARPGRSEGRRSASSGQAGAADTVELSTAAGRVRQALDAAAGARAARVGGLEAAYRSGVYVADSQETSRAMIREAMAGGTA